MFLYNDLGWFFLKKTVEKSEERDEEVESH